MTGEDFIDLAIRLSSSSNEADLRTSVSRSYYGAFHVALAFVEECGVVFPRTAETHKKLVLCLRQSGDADAIEAGDKLDSLRSERNDADYRLAEMRFQARANAAIQLQAARDTMDAINKCRANNVTSQVRSAARSLGLFVPEID